MKFKRKHSDQELKTTLLQVDDTVHELLAKWVQERYIVHLKKDVEKLPPPWTDWDVLQKYRYTNVRREHDTESINLINEVCTNKDLTLEEKIMNCVVFRCWNKMTTFKLMGFPRNKKQVTQEEVNEAEARMTKFLQQNPTYSVGTAAYITGTLKKVWRTDDTGIIKEIKEPYLRFFILWNYLVATDFGKNILLQKSAFDTAQYITSNIKAFGDFFTHQVFVDYTYCDDYLFTEDNWATTGKGCKLGLSYLFGGETKDISHLDYTFDDLLYYMRFNGEKLLLEKGVDVHGLMTDLPEEKRFLTLANWENIFCELGKTCKNYFGQGRIKRIYKPATSLLETPLF